MGIGKRIRDLRKARRWTQAQLGELAGGLPQGTIAKVEGPNSNPTAETLQAIAGAFGMSLAELIENEAAPAIERPPREVLHAMLSASQVAVVEADWDRWTPSMQRRFLRNLDELRAGQAAIEEARRQLLEFDALPEPGSAHVPLQQNKARAGT